MSILSIAGLNEIRGLGTASTQNLLINWRMITSFGVLVGSKTAWPATLRFEKDVLEPWMPDQPQRVGSDNAKNTWPLLDLTSWSPFILLTEFKTHNYRDRTRLFLVTINLHDPEYLPNASLSHIEGVTRRYEEMAYLVPVKCFNSSLGYTSHNLLSPPFEVSF